MNKNNNQTECDCMRCENTFLGESGTEFCPACSCNMNRPLHLPIPIKIQTFGRLGDKKQLNKQIRIAKNANATIEKTKDTVIASIRGVGGAKTELFRAICKGENAWLIMYNKDFYAQ